MSLSPRAVTRPRSSGADAFPYGEGITFWPVVEVVQEAAGLDRADSAGEARARIAATLPPGEDTVVADRLAAIVGVGGSAGAIQESFWAIRRYLEHLATTRPLVVVFDDIQWAKPTFLDLVQYLAAFSTGHPMLILGLSRPELLEVRSNWSSVGPVIWLEPLAPEESGRLVESLLGEAGSPEQVERQIVESAGGNPCSSRKCSGCWWTTGCSCGRTVGGCRGGTSPTSARPRRSRP
jgi:predicted ATPase